MLNVTGIAPDVGTHLRLWPTGFPEPTTSNLNLPAGDTRAGTSLVKLGRDHSFTIRNNAGRIDVAVDVVGWVDDGGVDDTGNRFVPTEPKRVADTRSGTGGIPTAKIAAGASVAFPVAGSCPASTTSVVLNVTI